MAELQTKSDRSGAWKTFNKLQQVRSWLTADERANTYRWAGELAFVEQNLQAAQEFLDALAQRKGQRRDCARKVECIRSTLLGKERPRPRRKASRGERLKTSA